MVECRSLVEFCRAYEQHMKKAATSKSSVSANHHQQRRSSRYCNHGRRGCLFDGFADSFCDQFTISALIDILLLFLVVGAVGVLVVPYVKILAIEASGLFVALCFLITDFVYDVPLPYIVTSMVGFFCAIGLSLYITFRSRKCGKRFCKGLRKSVEFDIQLETEQCVKCYPPVPKDAFGAWPVELGEDRKELEAELKKMAPINGRTVLIFRAPCGCPTGRMEVWGSKKVRRIKK